MILSIQAHLDDRELNSYGLLVLLKKVLNTKIQSLVFCNGRGQDVIERRKAHEYCSKFLEASDRLLQYKDLTLYNQSVPEISDIIYNEIKEIRPQCILFPSESDLHQDHKFLSQTSKIAIQRYIRDFQIKSLTCIEVLCPSIFSNLRSFKQYHLTQEEYINKCELLELYTTEKLQPLEYEYFREHRL